MAERYRKPQLLRRKDMRLGWGSPRATEIGHARGLYNGLDGTACNACLAFIAIGQESPRQTFAGEHIILQLRGEVEWEMADETYILEQYDMLFVPADEPYVFRNVGFDHAFFCSFIGRYKKWPPD